MKSVDFEKSIMEKIRRNQITMKPKWYFILGSTLMMIGLTTSTLAAIFLMNLTIFLLRRHGPNGQWRLEMMYDSFPLWIPLIAVLGIGLGVWLLKKYDFAYKKNFLLISIGFVMAIVMAGFIIDGLGLNDMWSRQGPMRRFYQQIENRVPDYQKGPGRLFNVNGNRLNRFAK